MMNEQSGSQDTFLHSDGIIPTHGRGRGRPNGGRAGPGPVVCECTAGDAVLCTHRFIVQVLLTRITIT